jgi:hypothetical protein
LRRDELKVEVLAVFVRQDGTNFGRECILAITAKTNASNARSLPFSVIHSPWIAMQTPRTQYVIPQSSTLRTSDKILRSQLVHVNARTQAAQARC